MPLCAYYIKYSIVISLLTLTALQEAVELTTSRSTPVGPVAGGIMGCFLVLALSVYCYRHRIHRNSHQYISTLPENQNRMSHYYDTDDIDPVEDPGNGMLLLTLCILMDCPIQIKDLT